MSYSQFWKFSSNNHFIEHPWTTTVKIKDDTFPKSTIETLEKDVKYVQINNKDTKTTSLKSP